MVTRFSCMLVSVSKTVLSKYNAEDILYEVFSPRPTNEQTINALPKRDIHASFIPLKYEIQSEEEPAVPGSLNEGPKADILFRSVPQRRQ